MTGLRHTPMQLLGFLFLISTIASTAKSFDLVAHRTHDCLVGTAKFVCFNIPYFVCCEQDVLGHLNQRIAFLSMSQLNTVSADILIIIAAHRSDGYCGHSVGSSIYGCANEESIGLPYVRSCVYRNCAKRSVMASEGGECKGTREADAVFYKGFFAYDAQPKDERHIELIHKIDMDEELTESELQELEPLRMPFADIQNTTSVDGSKVSVLSILNAP